MAIEVISETHEKVEAAWNCLEWCFRADDVEITPCISGSIVITYLAEESPAPGYEITIDGYTLTAENPDTGAPNKWTTGQPALDQMEEIKDLLLAHPYFSTTYDIDWDGTGTGTITLTKKECGNIEELTAIQDGVIFNFVVTQGVDAVLQENYSIRCTVELLFADGTTKFIKWSKTGYREGDYQIACFDIREIVNAYVGTNIPRKMLYDWEDCEDYCVIAYRVHGAVVYGEPAIEVYQVSSAVQFAVNAVLDYEEVDSRLKHISFNDIATTGVIRPQFLLMNKERTICPEQYDWLYFLPRLYSGAVPLGYTYEAKYSLYDSAGGLIVTESLSIGGAGQRARIIPTGVPNAIELLEGQLFTFADNGTMEANITDITAGLNITQTQSTEEAFSGTKSLKSKLAAGFTTELWSSDTFVVTGTQKYIVRAFVFVRHGSNFSEVKLIGVGATIGDFKQWTPEDGYDKWVEIYSEFTYAASPATISMVVTGGAVGDVVYTDQVRVGKVYDWDHYDVWVEETDSVGPTITSTEVIRFTRNNEDCCTTENFMFLNKLGGYENFQTRPAIIVEDEIEKDSILSPLDCRYEYGDRERKHYNIIRDQSYTSFTKRYHEKSAARIIGMFLYSPEIFLLQGTKFTPIVIDSDKYQTWKRGILSAVGFVWRKGWLNFNQKA
jgi:hypothetical protein